jgi:hypothetical protein
MEKSFTVADPILHPPPPNEMYAASEAGVHAAAAPIDGRLSIMTATRISVRICLIPLLINGIVPS